MNQKINLLLKKLDAFLESKTSKLTGKHKLLILLGACLLPVAVFALLVAMPALEEMESQNSRVASLTSEINRLRGVAAQLDLHKEEMAAVEEQLRQASLLLPEEREIPSLLTNISNLGTQAGLDFILFRPQNEARKEFYAEIPVDITVRGPYHNVGAFLDRISKLPRIVTVNNINMGSPTAVGNVMYLNTTFTLLTYRFIEPEPEEEAPARPAARRR